MLWKANATSSDHWEQKSAIVCSLVEDREVEATVCLRATQRLAEYEKMLEDLSQRRSNALVHNETEQAERILMAMADCRDTVLRAIHVDLLLGRGE
ncbi:hypothetical protein OESDEN_17733, partial [Oesophagostomum dentatum]